MKKIIAILVLTFLCGMTGCGKHDKGWDLVPQVMVNDEMYIYTGLVASSERRYDEMDGEITSSIEGNERPTENNQSNFGKGFGYQYGSMEGTIEIYMGGEWIIYATSEVRKQLNESN